jgi:tetratricopeptide (TPR) repeat protein
MSIRSLITILIIFSPIRIFCSTQTDSLLAFADKQYAEGNYNIALKEYLRIGFVQNFSEPSIQLRIANTYYRTGNWPVARYYYDLAFRMAGDDSTRSQSKFSKISSLISEKKYKQALIDLYNINDSIYQKHYVEIDLLFGICFFGLEDFSKSCDYFKHAVNGNEIARAKIDSIFKTKRMFYRPKPAIAYTLSIILPGLGQMYVGDVPQGLNSFFLTESLFLAGLFIAYEYSIIDAIISILPWYQRYFMGGLDNTLELAISKRGKRRATAYKEILDIISATSR